MILKHAIRYLELTGSDFITDLKDFADLQNSFVAGYIPDDFTEQMESFTDKLLILWVDCNGGLQNALDDKTEIPTTNELINIFCKTVFIKEKEETEDDMVFFSSSSLIKKKKDTVKENKTLELLTILGNNEIDITQFMEMELELVYKIIELIAEKKKEEKEKEKRRKRKGM